MDLETFRACALALPHATEDVQWECLLFRVARKIFALAALEPDNETRAAFKCTPERFAELCEREDIIPQPYMARNHWVGLVRWEAMRDAEIREAVSQSYRLVLEKLPKKLRAELEAAAPAAATKARRTARKRRSA